MARPPPPAGIRHAFADPALLARALTHRSADRANNERLEFLGDAVLGMLVSEELFRRHPAASEGELTRMRAALVREATLARLARELQLGDALRLGPGELASGGFRRDSILADAFEAVLAAVFLDGGIDAARRELVPLLEPLLAERAGARVAKDAKTALQERLQAEGLPLPVYTLVDIRGADHQRTFVARCEVGSRGIVADGEGGSRRAAETEAAARVLEQLDRVAPRP